MASKQKTQAESQSHAQKLDQADESNLQGEPMAPSTLPEDGERRVKVAADYVSAEAEIFLSVLKGIRIQVPDSEHPSATAEKLIKLHQELMLKARQAGILSDAPAPIE